MPQSEEALDSTNVASISRSNTERDGEVAKTVVLVEGGVTCFS